jgi:hypothetical protein
MAAYDVYLKVVGPKIAHLPADRVVSHGETWAGFNGGRYGKGPLNHLGQLSGSGKNRSNLSP